MDNSEIYLSHDDYHTLDKSGLTQNRVAVFSFHGPLTFLSVGVFRMDLESKILSQISHFRTLEMSYDAGSSSCSSGDGPLSSSSAEQFAKDVALELTHSPRVQHCWVIVLDMSQILYIDLSGLEVLQKIYWELLHQNIQLVLAAPTISVLSTLERANFFNTHVKKHDIFVTIHDAVVKHQTRLT